MLEAQVFRARGLVRWSLRVPRCGGDTRRVGGRRVGD